MQSKLCTLYSSLPLLMISQCLLAGGWTTVNRNHLDEFNPGCLYMAQLNNAASALARQKKLMPESLPQWTLATAVAPETLEFTPIQSYLNARQPTVIISSTGKGNDYVRIPGKGRTKGTFADQELREYCPPSRPVPVDIYGTRGFSENCIYRVQDWSRDSSAWYLHSQANLRKLDFIPYLFLGLSQSYRFEITSHLKNVTQITTPDGSQLPLTRRFTQQCGIHWQTATDNDFNPNCLYRVQLDNNPSYQMVYAVDSSGMHLYANSFIPEGYEQGTHIDISFIDLTSYTLTYGSQQKTGKIRSIQFFCP